MIDRERALLGCGRNDQGPAIRRAALLALSLAACSSGGKTAEVTPGGTGTQSVPQAVDSVRSAGSQKFPSAQLGTLYRYARGNFKPDVYLYNKSGWPDPKAQGE